MESVMDRDIVADSPKLGMTFMYHRRDGLWLFKVSSISGDYIVYDYKYYKGGKARASVEIEELVDWCAGIGWSGGSSNHIDRWKTFIIRGSESGDWIVHRVILVDSNRAPSWEV